MVAMEILDQRALSAAIPPTTDDHVPTADLHLVSHIAVVPRPLGDCEFCPPGDPARAATAQLLSVQPGRGVVIRDVGPCCIREALHDTIADHGAVTVMQLAAGQ